MTAPSDYWNRVAESKTFHHPLDVDRVRMLVTPAASILDVGCGYGRTLAQLADLGYHRLVGVDTAAGMIARGRRLHPDLDLRVIAPGPLPFPDVSFGAAFLVAVLTCIPADDDQRALVAEIRRVLRPGGVLYVSDLLLAADERNVARYREGADASRGTVSSSTPRAWSCATTTPRGSVSSRRASTRSRSSSSTRGR